MIVEWGFVKKGSSAMSFFKILIVVVVVLHSGSFVQEAFAEAPVTINQTQQGVVDGCRGDGGQKKVRFLDENGDGLNDLLQDSDGDGIPDGRMCNGSGYGAGRGAFYRQGGGGMMIDGAGRGFGNGFRQGRGRR